MLKQFLGVNVVGFSETVYNVETVMLGFELPECTIFIVDLPSYVAPHFWLVRFDNLVTWGEKKDGVRTDAGTEEKNYKDQ